MKRAFEAVASFLLQANGIGESKTTAIQSKTKYSYDDDSTVVVSNKRRKISGTRSVKEPKIERTTVSSPQSVLCVPINPVPFPNSTQSSEFLTIIPYEVVGYILTFVTSVSDRFAVQSTCRQFRDLSDHDCILSVMNLRGDATGKHAVILKTDSPEASQRRLKRFAMAINLEAIYMLGMIRAYCFEDVAGGVSLLRVSSKRGHVQSCYALGLMLRDNEKQESSEMLMYAANQGYFPAQQEVYPAQKLKKLHGELEATELANFLDAPCLSELLNRKFRSSCWSGSEGTSHCWNPYCGRWAYKQNASAREIHEYCVLASPQCHHMDPTVVCVLSAISSCNDIPSSNSKIKSKYPHLTNHKIPEKVSRMKMCSSCRSAKYCSKLCQVFDWRSGRHKSECSMYQRGQFTRLREEYLD